MNSRPRLYSSIILMLSALLVAREGWADGGLSQKSKKEELKEERQEQKERNRIKASGILLMSVWKYTYSFGKPDKKGFEISSSRYNPDGYKTEETVYNPNDGSVLVKTNYRYNEGGKLIEETTTKGDAKTKIIYRYDSAGNKKETVAYKQDGTVDRKSVYFYDSENNMVENRGYLSDGRIFSKDLFTYDSTGNVVEQLNSISRFTYAYDDDGNMTEMIKYGRDFNNVDSAVYNLADRVAFVYDSLGNLSSEYVYKPDSSLKARSTFTYDRRGNLVSEVDYSGDGHVNYSAAYIYNKRGDLVEESGVEKERPFKSIYKYDRKGNKKEWIVFDQVNEPKTLQKYLYEKYSSETNPEFPDSSIQADYVQPDTSETHGINEDLFQFLGCRIIASDGAYLGLVWADTSHPHSIVNPWGQYGFEGSPTSIFNPNCPYGGLKGVFSPFNKSCPSPPSLYREGKFVSYLSDNTSFSPRVPASRLMTFLMQQAKSKE
ncbi:MAG TPA: hypothetical protein VMF88_05715 [Bacteroidota bacterium]|nr:hypothetical protein [Bacteroidota bacterium]